MRKYKQGKKNSLKTVDEFHTNVVSKEKKGNRISTICSRTILSIDVHTLKAGLRCKLVTQVT